MFEAPVEERPVALTVEFHPRSVRDYSRCDPFEFVKYLYGLGYAYEGFPKEADFLAAVEATIRGDLSAAKGALNVYEGWWDNAAAHNARAALSVPPRSSGGGVPVPAVLAGQSTSTGGEFCKIPADQMPPNRPPSKFMEITNDVVREAAVKAAVYGDKKANATVTAYVNELSSEAK
ncbi:MAG: hypothetical protein ACK56I_32340, partial [bacterium]